MPKQKSITELQDEKRGLITRSKEIIAEARKENRQFSTEESKEMGEAQTRMAEINIMIEEQESENRGKSKPQKTERYSLRKSIASLAFGTPLDGVNAEVNAASAKNMEGTTSRNAIYLPVENRAAFTAATESQTGVLIDQEQQEILLPLQANLVLANAGAKFMTGLRGDIYWPSYSGSNVKWAGENEASQDGAGTVSKGKLFKPHRLTAYADISNTLLIQENMNFEAIIRQTLAEAIAQKVEKTAFSADAHVDGIPDGLFLTLPTNKGAMNWQRVVQMETDADVNNALFGNLAYIMRPELIGKAKTSVKDASGAGGFLFGSDGKNMLNGYKALRTTNLPTGLQEGADEHGIVFGNWADFFIGQWGSIEIKVDPYTQLLQDTTRLVINSYWDLGPIRDESFATATMK